MAPPHARSVENAGTLMAIGPLTPATVTRLLKPCEPLLQEQPMQRKHGAQKLVPTTWMELDWYLAWMDVTEQMMREPVTVYVTAVAVSAQRAATSSVRAMSMRANFGRNESDFRMLQRVLACLLGHTHKKGG